MIDPFVLLAPILLLAVLALLRFVGCDKVFRIDPITPTTATITGFDPPDATVGDDTFSLTVIGSGFKDGVTVTFGNTPVQVMSVTPLTVQIPATAPELANAGQVTVTVTNPSEASVSMNFSVFELITVLFPGPQPGTGNNITFDANWGWELGTSDDPFPHIYAATSGTFAFAGPRLLKSLEVGANDLGGTVQITDDTTNPPLALPIDPVPPRTHGSSVTLTTNWKQKSTTVSVGFSMPNSLDIHRITYQGPA